MSQITHCPKCHADFDGGPIPKNMRQFYSPPYRWSRIIGVERLEDDWVSSWRCPDCGHEWPR